jgi:adenosylmethionine-8-amino-7-oxononanoate aminotransferase
MSTILWFVLDLAKFMLALSVLVIIHEWGHYIAARQSGVRVETFSIGFGRRLFTQLSGWSPLDFGYSNAELLEQTDVQICALAWLMQISISIRSPARSAPIAS